MPHYLICFSYPPETWAGLIANPEDRREEIKKTLEPLGGTLHGYWYAFGDHDGYVALELPDNVSAAAFLATIAASGAAKVSTVPLMTVEETLEALKKAKGVEYRAPGK
ncbi:MAG: GYD domain-containing protein [Gaiellaceae bacterium]